MSENATGRCHFDKLLHPMPRLYTSLLEILNVTRTSFLFFKQKMVLSFRKILVPYGLGQGGSFLEGFHIKEAGLSGNQACRIVHVGIQPKDLTSTETGGA